MSDTPRCDQHVSNWRNLAPGEVSTMEFARQLERELNAAKAENADMRATMQIIYDAADSCADGAPDASDHDKLCLELTHTLQPYLK